MVSITILLTCHNRMNMTKQCINTINDDQYDIRYVVVDDGSNDGTYEMLHELQKIFQLKILSGEGDLFWAGGMRKAIAHALQDKAWTDYYVLVNDDVFFYPHVLEKAIRQSRECGNAIITGATCNQQGSVTYGGIKYIKGIHYKTVMAGCQDKVDTFNCNFVLLPQKEFVEMGNFDTRFRHILADLDYGLRFSRTGKAIYVSQEYVGVCEKNDGQNTWMDTALKRRERIAKKETPKGLPRQEWFHFLKKHFGLYTALTKSISPYIRIMLKK